MVAIKYAELLCAFEFASSGAPFEHGAYICPDTGKIYWVSSMIEPEEEVPDDLETSDRYVAVPHKNDLDLGRNLAFAFVDRELPDDHGTVADFFRRKGAYGLFKALLVSRGALERWYVFEADETETALRGWCRENGIQLDDA